MKRRGRRRQRRAVAFSVISEYCKGNSLSGRVSVGAENLLDFISEDVSFATDQNRTSFVRVGNTDYGNYDSGPRGQLRAYFRHLKRGLKYSLEFENSSGGAGYRGLRLGTRMRPKVTVIVLLCPEGYANDTIVHDFGDVENRLSISWHPYSSSKCWLQRLSLKCISLAPRALWHYVVESYRRCEVE
ncbi:hypothetical protein Adt_13014 [Abeliophyllum distichum]|uniref:Uncharacterized protein n=1 Tax=Abeliophyllum distichum TaxID=126358 RepID=A0ABD1TVK9_9LAMI